MEAGSRLEHAMPLDSGSHPLFSVCTAPRRACNAAGLQFPPLVLCLTPTPGEDAPPPDSFDEVYAREREDEERQMERDW